MWSVMLSCTIVVPSRSVAFRTYLAIVTGGFCTCLAIVPVSSDSCVSLAYVTLPPGRACEANDQISAQRSVRSVGISDRSVGDLRSTGRKL